MFLIPARPLAGCTSRRAGCIRRLLTGWRRCKGGVWLHEPAELPPSHRHPTAIPANRGRCRWRRIEIGPESSHTLSLACRTRCAQVTMQSTCTGIMLAFSALTTMLREGELATYTLLGAGISNSLSLDASPFCRSSTLDICCSFLYHHLILVVPFSHIQKVVRQRQKLVF
jgi:hypothetical protein